MNLKTHAHKKVFADQEIPKKNVRLSSQLFFANILQKQTCTIFRVNKKIEKEKKGKKVQKQIKETFIGWNQKSVRAYKKTASVSTNMI